MDGRRTLSGGAGYVSGKPHACSRRFNIFKNVRAVTMVGLLDASPSCCVGSLFTARLEECFDAFNSKCFERRLPERKKLERMTAPRNSLDVSSNGSSPEMVIT